MSKYADLVFLNGDIYTVDEKREWAQAVAVLKGRIIYVGEDNGAVEYIGKGTRVVNLEKRFMIPGFIDSHAHPIAAGFLKSEIRFDMDESLQQCVDKVRAYIAKNPDREVYFGQGFQEHEVLPLESPRTVLDKLCDEKPILLVGSGGHTGWCNSIALKMAGIDEKTEDPIPGLHYYRRDEKGVPDGLLIETWGNLVGEGKIEPYNVDRVKCAMAEVSKAYTKAGVTSIQDGGTWPGMLDMALPIVDQLRTEGVFNQRIQGCEFLLERSEKEVIVDRVVRRKAVGGDDFQRIDYLKVMNDGVFEGKTAAMIEPYSADGTVCEPMISEEELRKLFLEAADSGLDICVHCIGDRANREVLYAAGYLREKGFLDTRITTIHSVCIHPDDLELYKKYNVIANTTPVWFLENKFKEEMIGERAQKNYMMNTLFKSGAIVTFSSDYPTDWYGKEPLKGIEMGITRQLFDAPEMPVLRPLSERLTVKQMIKGYTKNAAYQMRMEDVIGTIEVGKYADFVVIEENLFETDPHSIHEVPIAATVYNGEIKYLRKGVEF